MGRDPALQRDQALRQGRPKSYLSDDIAVDKRAEVIVHELLHLSMALAYGSTSRTCPDRAGRLDRGA